MHDELVVAVLIQTFHAAPVPPDAKHARRRIARKDQPFRFERMKLRVDNGAVERNQVPFRSIRRPTTIPVAAF